MKKHIAIFLAIVSVLLCLSVFSGCTDEGMLKTKQAFCNHRWKEGRREQGNCRHSYDVITYSCSKCQKTKKEQVSVKYEHDWQVIKTERGVDCQHQDYELIECSACKITLSNSFDTYGPHMNDGNGKCFLCGSNID